MTRKKLFAAFSQFKIQKHWATSMEKQSTFEFVDDIHMTGKGTKKNLCCAMRIFYFRFDDMYVFLAIKHVKEKQKKI